MPCRIGRSLYGSCGVAEHEVNPSGPEGYRSGERRFYFMPRAGSSGSEGYAGSPGGHVVVWSNADQIEVCREQKVVPPQYEEGQPIFLPFLFSGHTLSSEGKRAELRPSAFVSLVQHRINLHWYDSMALVDEWRAAR